jgi:hypothetical protein
MGNGQTILGLQMASKAPIIIHIVELGKSHVLLLTGRNFVRNNNGTGDIGNGKKRKVLCNGTHRGSKFALIRKDADLL